MVLQSHSVAFRLGLETRGFKTKTNPIQDQQPKDIMHTRTHGLYCARLVISYTTHQREGLYFTSELNVSIMSVTENTMLLHRIPTVTATCLAFLVCYRTAEATKVATIEVK